jgi:hypothetical protein
MQTLQILGHDTIFERLVLSLAWTTITESSTMVNNSKDNNNTMASTSAADNSLGSGSHSRSPATTNDDREKSASAGIENNSASNSFTSSTRMEAADAEHIRMRHSLSLIPDEEQECKELEDIPISASRVTQLHLDTEQDESDSYFDDHHDYQTGTNEMLSPESQGTDEDDFIKRIYETTIDGPCHGVIPSCQITIDQQLDLFTHCRHPSSFLSLFQEHGDSRDGVEALPPGAGMGMYVMPIFCEYCGAEHTNDCNGSCQRPALYLQKKRPPFHKPSALWDPATDHAIPQKRDKNSVSQGHGSSPLRKSWVAGLFGKEK